jgi:hypothetical protein
VFLTVIFRCTTFARIKIKSIIAPFYVSLIIFLSIGFILFAIQADAILKSTFKSVMGRQFLRKCFGFSSFGMIGECTRLIYDLIDKLEEDDIPGFLLLIDFEKAFDTVEGHF